MKWGFLLTFGRAFPKPCCIQSARTSFGNLWIFRAATGAEPVPVLASTPWSWSTVCSSSHTERGKPSNKCLHLQQVCSKQYQSSCYLSPVLTPPVPYPHIQFSIPQHNASHYYTPSLKSGYAHVTKLSSWDRGFHPCPLANLLCTDLGF